MNKWAACWIDFYLLLPGQAVVQMIQESHIFHFAERQDGKKIKLGSLLRESVSCQESFVKQLAVVHGGGERQRERMPVSLSLCLSLSWLEGEIYLAQALSKLSSQILLKCNSTPCQVSITNYISHTPRAKCIAKCPFQTFCVPSMNFRHYFVENGVGGGVNIYSQLRRMAKVKEASRDRCGGEHPQRKTHNDFESQKRSCFHKVPKLTLWHFKHLFFACDQLLHKRPFKLFFLSKATVEVCSKKYKATFMNKPPF